MGDAAVKRINVLRAALISVFMLAGMFIALFLGVKSVGADTRMSFETNSSESVCTAQLTGFKLPAGARKVQVAVWSETGGQDDLRWYDMKASGSAYKYDINIADHGSSGEYCAHFYYIDSAGRAKFINGGVFDITPVSCSGIKIENVNDSNGTCRVVISGVSSVSGVREVLVPIWSEANGQDDIIWHPAQKDSSGNYVLDLSIAGHKYNKGLYNIHAYGYGQNGVMSFLGKKTQDLTVANASVSAKLSGDKISISASGVPQVSGISKVQFAVWSETNGQDDIIWNDASYSASSGTASLSVSVNSYRGYGTYQIHMYGVGSSGNMLFLGKTTVDVPKPSCSGLKVDSVSGSSGKWTVTISGIKSNNGISSVTVPVWTEDGGQDDIVWYNASKNSNGDYVVSVDAANHGFGYGTYNFHAYVTDQRGIMSFLAKTTANYMPESFALSARISGSNLAMSAANIPNAGSFSKVQFVVWSETNGQDDIIWNNASITQSTRSASLTVSLNNYKGYGKYQVHLYGVNRSGSLKFLGKTTVDLPKPTCGSVSVKNFSLKNGTWQVVVSGINSALGIKSVTIPVWSEAGGQDDIIWYNATRNSSGEYVAAVDVANHGNGTGIYNVHAYVTAPNGEMSFLGKTTQEYVKLENASVSCSIVDSSNVCVTAGGLSGTSMTYGLFALDVGRDDITSSDVPVAEETGAGTVTFYAPLNQFTEYSLLNKKFVVAVKSGNEYVQISSGSYITNPESVAAYDFAFPTAENKKGLQVNYNYTGDAIDLGVNHTIVNVTLNSLFAGGTEPYTYNGTTYYFSADYLSYLDSVTAEMANSGVITSFILLLQYDGQTTDLILPGARTQGHAFYGFNVAEPEVSKKLEAAFTYLAERYSTSNVVNWILANEVDDYNTYYYCGDVSDQQAARYYTDAYRLLYNCVKSVYANARVYISLDHMWTYQRPNTMTGKEMLGYFTRQLAEEGDITWCLAYHPYPSPLTNANFWNTTSSNITNSINSGVFTMKNLSTLTNYIRDTYGSQHRIILSETGFTSVSDGREDQQLQAAAIAYAYYLAEFNDMVDSFIVHRHVDNRTEMAGGLHLGLWKNNSSYVEEASEQKFAWTVYKYMDTSTYRQVTQFALSKIGADSWESIVPGFDGSRFR